ncbi:MAG: serine hydrolase domain-containing protein [Gemmatimonadales bacterium]
MSPRIIRSAFALTATLAATLPAQNRSAEVDQYLTAEMARRSIPGLAVAIVRHGKVEKVRAYGKASLEHDASVTASTPFQINSTTKSFAAVATLMLVEAGKFRLDDPIGTHLEGLPATWRVITVRQLLNHTSGLPDVLDNPNSGTMLARTAPDALELLADKPLVFPAATSWSYNQTNYMLLAMLIEQASGMPFERFCLERELAPLGITSATFGDARAVVPGRATGYTKFRIVDGQPRPLDRIEHTWYEFDPFLYTAAALNISARDFGLWIAGLLAGKLVTRASLEEIWKPTRLADGSIFHHAGSPFAYGLGWPLIDRPAHRAAGGSGGARAGFFVYPDDDLAVVVLTNLQGAQPEQLVEGVARIFLPALP